jgi:leucyl aminopeptidase
MPTRLPFDEFVVPVRQTSGAISPRVLARYRSAILLLPVAPREADWQALPHGALLRHLHGEKPRKAGDQLELKVGARAETLLVIGLIDEEASTFKRLQWGALLARAALKPDPEAVLLFAQGCGSVSCAESQSATLAALEAAAFRLPQFKSKPDRKPRVKRIDLARKQKLADLEVTLATAAGNNLARWLTALPPNHLNARGYRGLLQQFTQRLGLKFKYYGERELKRLGAGAFLAVASGNAGRDAGIAHLSYRPRGARAAEVSLVGKGICFDTGGTNLKTHKSMLDMHTDMEGSAVALGSLYALKLLKSPLATDCWLAITENRIGPTAYQPQDVVRALNGTTIQVIHTDAEGRMVLADTLALAARRKPRVMIDYATLTGACVYALTERYSGAFSNRPGSRSLIEAAGTRSGERVWCFPLDDDYETDLESGIADIMQCALEGKGDHILAARFLKRFVPDSIAWLHLDLSAGTRAGGLGHISTDITGFGVRYTLDLLRRGWPKAGA